LNIYIYLSILCLHKDFIENLKLRINLFANSILFLKLKNALKTYYINNLSFSSTLAMAELPQDSRPGGIAVIPLTSDITQVTFQHKPVLISQEGQQRYAVLGFRYLLHW
jgi:hypothetical protein